MIILFVLLLLRFILRIIIILPHIIMINIIIIGSCGKEKVVA